MQLIAVDALSLYAAIITILDTNAKQLVKFLNLKRANP